MLKIKISCQEIAIFICQSYYNWRELSNYEEVFLLRDVLAMGKEI